MYCHDVLRRRRLGRAGGGSAGKVVSRGSDHALVRANASWGSFHAWKSSSAQGPQDAKHILALIWSLSAGRLRNQ